jgi:uncharacterized damage-inducible protein DinB
MKTIGMAILVLGLIAGGASRASAQTAAVSDKAIFDIKADTALDAKGLKKKFADLAGAVPAEKYNWRPAEGVRSIGEVYLHVAQANYGFSKFLGATPPITFETKGYEKSITDKAKIIEAMNQSFDFLAGVIDKMTFSDVQLPVKEFGPEANRGDVLWIISTHAHEHLGQSIAYARSNGIVPPWTAEAEKKAKAKGPQE